MTAAEPATDERADAGETVDAGEVDAGTDADARGTDASETDAATAAEAPDRPDTVLITGSSSGIGRATVRAFLREGWHVYATARNTADVADLRDAGASTAALDVTDEEQVAAVVERVLEERGRIDCLVNNAGYAQLGPVEDVPTTDVHRQFEVNVYGPHRLIREVVPHMRAAGDGTIVNVSSVGGRLSYPGNGVYTGSKFALEAMSDALRAEVAPFGVDVVLVEPGPVDTQFADRVVDELRSLPRSDAYDDMYELLDDAEVVGGGGPLAIPPEEVADAILNAASCTDPEPRYPVGQFAKYAMLARYVPDRWRDAVYGVLRKLT